MSGMETVGSDGFQGTVLEAGVPVLVDFSAQWCPPCRLIAPALEALAKRYEGRVKLVTVDVDQAADLAERFAVAHLPTLVVFKGGEEVDRKVGALPKPALERWVAGFAA